MKNISNMATDGQMEKTLKKPVVAVVGLGLIGGSMAIALKRRGFTDHVIGVENDKVNAAAAEKIGLADEVVPLEDAVKQADIIIIAVPVGAAVKMLPEILDMFRETGGSDKIVIDTCSTKGQIVRSVHYHPLRARYVATHPMAGTEYSGPWAAMPGLFDGRACIFANSEESDPKAVATIENLYGVLNMRPTISLQCQKQIHGCIHDIQPDDFFDQISLQKQIRKADSKKDHCNRLFIIGEKICNIHINKLLSGT